MAETELYTNGSSKDLCERSSKLNKTFAFKRKIRESPFLDLNQSKLNFMRRDQMSEEHFVRQRTRKVDSLEFHLDASVLRQKLKDTLANPSLPLCLSSKKIPIKRYINRIPYRQDRSINLNASAHTTHQKSLNASRKPAKKDLNKLLAVKHLIPIESTKNDKSNRPAAPSIAMRLPVLPTYRK